MSPRLPLLFTVDDAMTDAPTFGQAAISWDGKYHEADLAFVGTWRRFSLAASTSLSKSDGPVWAPGLPVEIHCHGIGGADFSDFESLSLRQAERVAAQEGIACVLTMYLPQSRFSDFERFMHRFSLARSNGQLPHIVGIALEGPLLASFGGTPEMGVWAPTTDDWRRLVKCGPLGLKYVVLSPDAPEPGSHLAKDFLSGRSPPISWITSELIDNGIKVALGHFSKADPVRSAACVEELLLLSETRTPGSGNVITDHLFNDMPLNFKHAFRTPDELRARSAAIAAMTLEAWTLDTIWDRAGPVPATIVRAASKGRLTACINCDGEHVDLSVVKRAVQLMGAANVILMTDRCDGPSLGGQALTKSSSSGLWYQSSGMVAAGSRPIDHQIRNARRCSFVLQKSGAWFASTLGRS